MVFAPDSVIVTDHIIVVAMYTTVVVIALVGLLMLQVIFIRLRMISNRNYRYRLLKKWRPQLTRILLGDDKTTPILPRKEICIFLEEWNKLFGSVRGEHLEALVRLAHRLRIGFFARRMLKRRAIRVRLFAIVTLGHMREYAAWDELVALMHHHNPALALTAARALLLIDAKNSMDIVIPIILQRGDLPWANVAHLLKQAPVQAVCKKLADALQQASLERQSGLLRFLEAAHCVQLSDAVLKILQTTDDDHVASVCLHIITDSRALPRVRNFSAHSRWHVRMHAASALGRMGNEDDVDILTAMLTDEQWWVRYRAAQALAAMPFVSREKLQALQQQQQDKFAADILLQVLAEKTRP